MQKGGEREIKNTYDACSYNTSPFVLSYGIPSHVYTRTHTYTRMGVARGVFWLSDRPHALQPSCPVLLFFFFFTRVQRFQLYWLAGPRGSLAAGCVTCGGGGFFPPRRSPSATSQ